MRLPHDWRSTVAGIPPAVIAEASPEPQLAYASWGSRVGAYLLDGLLLAIPYVLGFVLAIVGDETGSDALLIVGWLIVAASIVLPFVYFAVLNGNERGQTWGKRVVGIRVRRDDGSSPLGAGRALARYAITFVFAFFFYIPMLLDYLWPLWDDRNQALHDKVAGSVVVRA
jgi:uncharacterized RDD family membrane protein YckC